MLQICLLSLPVPFLAVGGRDQPHIRHASKWRENAPRIALKRHPLMNPYPKAKQRLLEAIAPFFTSYRINAFQNCLENVLSTA